MTSIFDGLSGVLNDVFGAPVTYLPASGGERVIQSVFRRDPVEILNDEGRAVLVMAASWRVPYLLAGGIAPGDRIEPGNGRIYKLLSRTESESPAGDRFVVFELEDLRP